MTMEVTHNYGYPEADSKRKTRRVKGAETPDQRKFTCSVFTNYVVGENYGVKRWFRACSHWLKSTGRGLPSQYGKGGAAC